MSEDHRLTQSTRAFSTRHRFLVVLLWALVPILAAIGLTQGASIYEVVVASLVLMVLALVGMTARGRTFASGVVTLGLVAASGIIVTYLNGSTESRFAFLFTIVAISLYNDWKPLALGFASVAAYHIFAGFVLTDGAFPQTQTVENQVWWVAIQLSFTLLLVLLLVAGWRLATRADARRSSTEEGFRLSFEKAPIGIAVLKPSGEFLQANEALAEMLGHEEGNLIGANIKRVIHADDLSDLGEAWEEMGNGDSRTATAWLRCRTVSGRTIWGRVTLSLVPWAPNQPAVVMLQIEDATRTYQDQRHLEQHIKGKDEFVAAIGDEIREPLSSVLELTSHARGGHADLDGIVEDIEGHAREIASILDALIISARANSNPVSVVARSVDVEVSLGETLERIPDAENIPISIGAPTVWADPGLIRQIMYSLVNNAIRYGGPSIELKTATSGPDTVIQVIDDGPEIPVAERERIFSGDLRSGQLVTRPAAVGLGLTVGRHLARQMEGDIAYRRTDDGRNIFELRLPSEQLSIIYDIRSRLEPVRTSA